MKKAMAIKVRGERESWMFHFQGDPKHLREWQADGLDVVEIQNTIPEWVASLGLTRVWCFAQDVFHFRNPFN
jgi:hypothetical protein